MSLSWDEDYRSRRMLRQGGPLLTLREPAIAYGLAALVIMYATGLMAVLWAVTGFARIDVTTATALALPAGAATAATALAVGTRLRRYEEKSRIGVIAKIVAVWAFFGAAWPAIHVFADYFDTRSFTQSMDQFIALGRSFALQGGAGAIVGAIGGLAGGIAALALCVEARS
jgi:hypothetical protein